MIPLPTGKEYWLRLAKNEPDCPITAGIETERDALWHIQLMAAVGIEETNDTGPLADIFAAIHRKAAGALMAKGHADELEKEKP